MKKILSYLILFIIMGFIASANLPAEEIKTEQPEMIIEKVSPFGLEETVNRIKENAEGENWVITIKDLDKNMEKQGVEVLPIKQIELCNPELAGKMLKDDNSRYVSVMMPCTVSVYEKTDGRIYVSFVNAFLVGKMFGGTIEEVMSGPVAEAQQRFLNFLEENE